MSQGNIIRLHRVFRQQAGEGFSRLPRCGSHGQVAATLRLHLQGSPFRAEGWRRISNVVFEFHHEHRPFVRGEYLEIVPNERIRYTDRFDDPNLPGVIEVTVTLKAVSCGTEINIEQANLPP